MSSTDLMVDIETLSSRSDAAIVQIGLLPFNRDGSIGMGFKVNVRPEIGHVDVDTVRWWLAQEREAQQSLLKDPIVDLRTALQRAAEFIERACGPDVVVWSLPASFDLVILENAYRAFGMRTPWKYSGVRCLRTALDLLGVGRDERLKATTAHDAVSDCRAQVGTLVMALKRKDAEQWTIG